jgi:hypothetical protein
LDDECNRENCKPEGKWLNELTKEGSRMKNKWMEKRKRYKIEGGVCMKKGDPCK